MADENFSIYKDGKLVETLPVTFPYRDADVRESLRAFGYHPCEFTLGQLVMTGYCVVNNYSMDRRNKE